MLILQNTNITVNCFRIGRLRERQYQRNAQRRNEASTKIEHYREVAKYFERECVKADQFNSWNAQESKESRCLEARRRTDQLGSRREKLRDLLSSEEREYARECEKLKCRRAPKVDFSLTGFRDRLKENRAEESLYRPRACRRIQSYLYGAYGPRQDSRPALREFNGHANEGAASRASDDMMNQREENGDAWERKSNASEDVEQDGYNARMAEYKENSRSARASHLYGEDPDAGRCPRNITSASRPGAGIATESDHRPRTRKLHDSHFIVGNQLHLQEQGGDHKEPNQKFSDRYANRSLEGTNVGETAAHSMEEGYSESQNGDADNEVVDEGADEADQAGQALKNMSITEAENGIYDDDRKENGDDALSASMKDNASECSQEQQAAIDVAAEDQRNEQRDIDAEVGAKASAGRSDHRHFECQKSLPWMRMIPREKNLSEQMFLYLTHNELKEKIQDLERRENQAANKHQWDEALRLRDMRNRLDLARERNLYRREDLMLDPEIKKLGMAAIEARSKLLKEREILCTNSEMYR